MRSIERPEAASTRTLISPLSGAGLNPYLDLFYRALASVGVPRGPHARFRLPWLWTNRTTVRYLHVHWPESLYRFSRGPSRLRPYLSWSKLALFAARLAVARALRYDLVWTIHQVYPHGVTTRLDIVAAKLLARHASVVLAHDPETAARAQSELALPERKVTVVPHGSYVGVYPPGRSRTEVRQALGMDEDAVVFLCFGELRANSDVVVLLEAFGRSQSSGTALVVAGHAKDRATGAAVAAVAATNDRVVRVDGFIPTRSVRELYEATDIAVVPRGDGGTSGSLILALSLGKPVVAADTPANRRLLAPGPAGWLFQPGDEESLRAALELAAGDRSDRDSRASAAQRVADSLDWNDAAREVAHLLPK